jgi:hypothetical protein
VCFQKQRNTGKKILSRRLSFLRYIIIIKITFKKEEILQILEIFLSSVYVNLNKKLFKSILLLNLEKYSKVLM